MITFNVHLHPADWTPLVRVVDPDGEQQGRDGVHLVSDGTIEQGHVKVVVNGTEEDDLGDLAPLVESTIEDFDLLTAGIIKFATDNDHADDSPEAITRHARLWAVAETIERGL